MFLLISSDVYETVRLQKRKYKPAKQIRAVINQNPPKSDEGLIAVKSGKLAVCFILCKRCLCRNVIGAAEGRGPWGRDIMRDF